MKNTIFKNLIISIFTSSLLLVNLVLINTVAANKGLVLSPTLIEIEADRNGVYEETLIVENDTTDQRTNMEMSLQTFKASKEDGTPELVSINKDDKINTWVTFTPSVFTLDRGKKQDVNVKITIPEKAESGSYYLALVVTTKNPTNTEGSRITINQGIGSLLFLNVKGVINRDVNFDFLKTNFKFYDSMFDPFSLEYKVSTNGNYYLKPAGNIFIKQGDSISQSFDLNPDKRIILPNTSRQFSLQKKSRYSLPFFTDENQNSKILNDSKDFTLPWFGQYTIENKITFLNSNDILETKTISTNIYVFPWKISLILLTLIIFIAILFIILKKKNAKQK